MTIKEKQCKIELKHDNIVPVEDCSPYENYIFIIQYSFHEASINQERWLFRISLQTGLHGEKTMVDEKIIDDTWGLTDISSGELLVEIPGHQLWESREYNYITLDCETLSDIAWLSEFSLVDEAHEITQVTVNTYLTPNLKIKAIDGTDWGKVGIRIKYPEKIFILKNEGDWVAENVNYELVGHEDFLITEGPKGAFDLEPNQQTQITITFNPESYGGKTALLRAHDEEYLFSTKDVALKGFGRITKSKNNAFSFSFLSNIFEKNPLFERLFTNLIS
jgi:hypothetical protein